MSKMTIVGQDGKPKYELDDVNNIVDVAGSCACTGEHRPEQRDGEQRVCLICGLKIK